MPRRSYDHYCPVGRALDVVGDRWTLLVIRELTAGPRRYSDLFADLPGISTDMLATRLKDLERDGLLTRTRLGPRASTARYELTDSGRALRPVLEALSAFGIEHLGERRRTDAVRAHWFAVPLGSVIAREFGDGVVNVRVGESVFHVTVDGPTITHADGEAPGAPSVVLAVDELSEVVSGERPLPALAT